MKTSIIITGSGINSKNTLINSIETFNCETKNLNFGNTEIIFSTKKEAVKAMSDAFHHLKSDKEDWDASCGSYSRGFNLSYDAAVARLICS